MNHEKKYIYSIGDAGHRPAGCLPACSDTGAPAAHTSAVDNQATGGCGGSSNDGGAAPSADPTTAAGYTPALTGAVWQWTASQAGDQVTPVTDPSRYQAQFNVDGSLNIKADCNNVTASYTAGEGNSMIILPGPSTLMACPEDSQADAFMQQLGVTATYGFSQGPLVLSQADPSLTMSFQMLPVAILPTPKANAPSTQATTGVNVRSGPGENYTIYGVLQVGSQTGVVGKSEDGKWWALNMPVSPTGRGWVFGGWKPLTSRSGYQNWKDGMIKRRFLDRLTRIEKRRRDHYDSESPVTREVYDDEIEPGEPLSDEEVKRFFANGGQIKEIIVHLGPRPSPCEPEEGYAGG